MAIPSSSFTLVASVSSYVLIELWNDLCVEPKFVMHFCFLEQYEHMCTRELWRTDDVEWLC